MKIIQQIRIENEDGFLTKEKLFSEIAEARKQVDITNYEISYSGKSYANVADFIIRDKGGIDSEIFKEAYEKNIVNIDDLLSIKIKKTSVGFYERMTKIIKNQEPAFNGFDFDKISALKTDELTYDEIGAILYPQEGEIVNTFEIVLKNGVANIDKYLELSIPKFIIDFKEKIRFILNEEARETLNKPLPLMGISIAREYDSLLKKRTTDLSTIANPTIIEAIKLFENTPTIANVFYTHTPGVSFERQKNTIISFLSTSTDETFNNPVKKFCIDHNINSEATKDLLAKDAKDILYQIISKHNYKELKQYLSEAKGLKEFLDENAKNYPYPFFSVGAENFLQLLEDFPEANHDQLFNKFKESFIFQRGRESIDDSKIVEVIIDNLEKFHRHDHHNNLKNVMAVALKFNLAEKFFSKIDTLGFSDFYKNDLSLDLISHNVSQDITETQNLMTAVSHGYKITQIDNFIENIIKKRETKPITKLKKEGIINTSSNTFYNSLIKNNLTSIFSKYLPSSPSEETLNFKNEDNTYLWWNAKDGNFISSIKNFNKNNPGILKTKNSKNNILNHLVKNVSKSYNEYSHLRSIFEIAIDVAKNSNVKIPINNSVDADGKNALHHLVNFTELTSWNANEILIEMFDTNKFEGQDNFKIMFSTKDKNEKYPIDYFFSRNNNLEEIEKIILDPQKFNEKNKLYNLFKACSTPAGKNFITELFNAPNSYGYDFGEKLVESFNKAPDENSTKILNELWKEELELRMIKENHENITLILNRDSNKSDPDEHKPVYTEFKL